MATSQEVPSQLAIAKVTLWRRRLESYALEIKTIRDEGRVAITTPSRVDKFIGMIKSLVSLYEKYETLYFETEEFCLINHVEIFPDTTDTSSLADVRRYKYEAMGSHVTIENAVKGSDPASTIPSHAATNQTIVNIPATPKLPEIVLPTFSGNIVEWVFFEDSLTASVHNREELSKIEKFTYLTGLLKSSALDTIRAIPISEANYDVAWAKLNAKYDNKRQLSSTYISKFLEGKPISRATPENLESFITKVLTPVDNFKNLTITDREDYLLFEIVVRYLDQPTRQAFEQSHSDTTHPTYAQLKVFLENRLQQLSRANLGVSVERSHAPLLKPNRFQPKSTTALHAVCKPMPRRQPQSTFQKPSYNCYVCHESHLIKDCPKFLAASPPQRNSMLKGWSGCKHCLGFKHNASQCTSTATCKYCQAKHHWLLHTFTSPSSFSPSHNSNTTGTSNLNQSFKQHEPLDPNTSTVNPVNLASLDQTEYKVLLGTAIAQIMDGDGCYQNVRILLDSGSQNCFISSECANRLKLNCHKAVCSVTGLNANVSTSEGLVYCSLKPRNSSLVFRTMAHIIPTIAPMLPQEPIHPSYLNFLPDLDLADPSFGIPGQIDFLLGANLFLRILRNSNPNMPAILNTVFGAVIMGPLPNTSNSTSTFSLPSIKLIDQPSNNCSETHLQIPPPEDHRWDEYLKQPIVHHDESRRCESSSDKPECDSRDLFPAELQHHPLWWAGSPRRSLPYYDHTLRNLDEDHSKESHTFIKTASTSVLLDSLISCINCIKGPKYWSSSPPSSFNLPLS